MERVCKSCLQKKGGSGFYKTYSYTRYVCKQCENKQRHEWRLRHAREMKQRAVEYLGGSCKRCGYAKSFYALEFNHIGDKKYEPTRMFYKGLSWLVIKKEIDKCELLCANCHREITFGNTISNSKKNLIKINKTRRW